MFIFALSKDSFLKNVITAYLVNGKPVLKTLNALAYYFPLWFFFLSF